MREQFAGFFEPTQEELDNLWEQCVFSFDANALLNVYRYTPDLRDRLFEILAAYSERLWLPHQAAEEYFANRVRVIQDQLSAYKKLSGWFDKLPVEVDKLLRAFSPHPYIDATVVAEKARSFARDVQQYLREQNKGHDKLLREDPLRERLLTLFGGRVGAPYAESELQPNLERAERRYKAKIPPGYEDTSKVVGHPYGDALIWFQLLDYARDRKQGVIFVTDDTKEDWWVQVNNQPRSPRPELIQEMRREANVAFYMFSGSEFIERGTEALKLAKNDEIIKEAEQVSQQTNFMLPPSVEAPITWEQLYGALSRPGSQTPFQDWVIRRLRRGDIPAHLLEDLRLRSTPLTLLDAYIAGNLAGAAGQYEGTQDVVTPDSESSNTQGERDTRAAPD